MSQRVWESQHFQRVLEKNYCSSRPFQMTAAGEVVTMYHDSLVALQVKNRDMGLTVGIMAAKQSSGGFVFYDVGQRNVI